MISFIGFSQNESSNVTLDSTQTTKRHESKIQKTVDKVIPDKKPLFASIEVKYHNDGFLENGANLDSYISGMNSHAWEVRMGINTNGKRAWQKLWKYPTYGIGFYQTYWEATSYLGNPSALFVYFNAPFTNPQKKFSLNYDVGVGVSYNFLAYDPNSNPENDLIGSDVNVYLNFRGELNWEVTKRFSADLGVGWTHFSNGRTRTPNIGVNLLGWDVGLKYHLRPSHKEMYKTDGYKPELIDVPIPEFEAFYEYYAVLSGGWRTSSNDVESASVYGVGSLAMDVARHYGHMGKYSVGLDIFYDSGLVEEYDKEGKSSSTSDYFFTGIHVGHELKIQKFSFITQLGFYLQEKPEKGTIYTRFGLRYDITKSFHIRGGLKTLNGFAADFIEWGVGYSIYSKKYNTLVHQFR